MLCFPPYHKSFFGAREGRTKKKCAPMLRSPRLARDVNSIWHTGGNDTTHEPAPCSKYLYRPPEGHQGSGIREGEAHAILNQHHHTHCCAPTATLVAYTCASCRKGRKWRVCILNVCQRAHKSYDTLWRPWKSGREGNNISCLEPGTSFYS